MPLKPHTLPSLICSSYTPLGVPCRCGAVCSLQHSAGAGCLAIYKALLLLLLLSRARTTPTPRHSMREWCRRSLAVLLTLVRGCAPRLLSAGCRTSSTHASSSSPVVFLLSSSSISGCQTCPVGAGVACAWIGGASSYMYCFRAAHAAAAFILHHVSTHPCVNAAQPAADLPQSGSTGAPTASLCCSAQSMHALLILRGLHRRRAQPE